eukprot:GHVH01008425.1.p1 GENE.GHVH01008425.1~~GHVH01008425.1.p1  ORF type:complete len:768 (+),score=118.21 GHVH01008425.1:83-2305(+)
MEPSKLSECNDNSVIGHHSTLSGVTPLDDKGEDGLLIKRELIRSASEFQSTPTTTAEFSPPRRYHKSTLFLSLLFVSLLLSVYRLSAKSSSPLSVRVNHKGQSADPLSERQVRTSLVMPCTVNDSIWSLPLTLQSVLEGQDLPAETIVVFGLSGSFDDEILKIFPMGVNRSIDMARENIIHFFERWTVGHYSKVYSPAKRKRVDRRDEDLEFIAETFKPRFKSNISTSKSNPFSDGKYRPIQYLDALNILGYVQTFGMLPLPEKAVPMWEQDEESVRRSQEWLDQWELQRGGRKLRVVATEEREQEKDKEDSFLNLLKFLNEKKKKDEEEDSAADTGRGDDDILTLLKLLNKDMRNEENHADEDGSDDSRTATVPPTAPPAVSLAADHLPPYRKPDKEHPTYYVIPDDLYEAVSEHSKELQFLTSVYKLFIDIPSLELIARDLPNFKIILNERRDPYANSNRQLGAELSFKSFTAEDEMEDFDNIVSYVDCDDITTPTRVHMIEQTFKENQEIAGVVHRFTSVDMTKPDSILSHWSDEDDANYMVLDDVEDDTPAWREDLYDFYLDFRDPSVKKKSFDKQFDNEFLRTSSGGYVNPRDTTSGNMNGGHFSWFLGFREETRISDFKNSYFTHNGHFTYRRNWLVNTLINLPNARRGEDARTHYLTVLKGGLLLEISAPLTKYTLPLGDNKREYLKKLLQWNVDLAGEIEPIGQSERSEALALAVLIVDRIHKSLFRIPMVD